ncbi:hypothetical protein J6590_024296 [Homalodisca vitripennis]|nr:hypothetical protein J6590_024296 [Homalodisca vitripennis]
MCKPGAKLLDIIQPDQTSTGPGPRCEVLIAGTNDWLLHRGQAGRRRLLLATLPHRHDLDPDHPVHEETVLVNAFVEELAVRHNVRMLKHDGVGRGYFTRHGQYLSMRGKRLLAEMIVSALASSVPESSLVGAAVAIAPSSGPLSAEVLGDRAGTLQSSPNLQHLSYADTVRGSPGESEKGRFHRLRIQPQKIFKIQMKLLQQITKFQIQNSKFLIQKLKIIHQNAQVATNKVDELALVCEELKPDVLVVSEHGFKPEAINIFKIQNFELANYFCRNNFKGGGVAFF